MNPFEHRLCNFILKGPADMPDCQDLPCTKTEVNGMPAFQSYWRPSDEERQAIARGGAVVLTLYGRAHPPVWVDVDATISPGTEGPENL